MDATTWQRPCRRRAATPAHPSRNLTPQHNAKPNPAPACGLAGAQLRQKAGSQHSLSALPQDDQRPWRQWCHVSALRRMNLKNAKKAAERQRRKEEVPANVAAVNTTGPCARVTSAAMSGAPTSGPMPRVNPGETFVHGELYVVFTDPDGRKVFVPYAPGSGALASLGQPCAHAAGTTCPCGASLSRWSEEDSSAEEASAAGTGAEEDGDTGTATPPEPLEDDVPSQGASAGGGDIGDGVAAPPSVSGHGGRELPPAGKKKKKKKKKLPPGDGVPAPPVRGAISTSGEYMSSKDVLARFVFRR